MSLFWLVEMADIGRIATPARERCDETPRAIHRLRRERCNAGALPCSLRPLPIRHLARERERCNAPEILAASHQ